MDYQLKCDHQRHIVLLVEVGPRFTKFISRDKKTVDLRKLPNAEFSKSYCYQYEDYHLEDYASKMLSNSNLGIVVTPRAKAHLTNLKEPLMAKVSAPVKDLAAPVSPKATEKVAKVEKVAKTPKAVVPAAEEGAEKAPRNRREKLDGGKRIKVIGTNPARSSSIRHGIVETIFAAKTVAEACDSTVTRKDGSEYKIGLPDLYFALDTNLIELY